MNLKDSVASQISTASADTTQSETLEETYVDGSIQTLGWKAVLLLQFQPQFEVVVMFGIFLSYVCSLVDIAFAFSVPVGKIPQVYVATGMGFIYAFDIVYIVDVLLMISYRNANWTEVEHLHDRRHAILLLLDIISVIPLDPVYYSLTVANMRVIYVLRLRYAFRIVRFAITLGNLKNTVGYDNRILELLVFLISFSIVLVTVSCLLYIVECQLKKCAYADFSMAIQAALAVSGVITSKGFAVSMTTSWSLYFLYLITNFCSFLYIRGFTVGRMLTATLYKFKEQYRFSMMRSLMLKKVALVGCRDNLLYSTCKVYFTLFWRNRKAIIFDNLNVKIIPEVMAKEISLDIAWDGLKHSHLFRDQDTHLLRCISPYVKQKFFIPGEVIFKRNQFKSAMVYVVSGVIQVLSEQDGETPILSFTAGTCIGESCLFIDYPSTCSVICQGYCELNVLYRKDFLRLMLKFPDECNTMLKNVQERYLKSQHYQDLLRYAHGIKRQKAEILTLKWLTITLNDLMLKNKAARLQHRKTLGLIEKEMVEQLNKLTFCADYLDLLVITEQGKLLVTDAVFLSTSCPCILQPDSFVITTWRKITGVAALAFTFIYPYYASFEPNPSDWYLVFSYVIFFLWGLDIYVSMSTAIRTRDGIVADIATITLINIKTVAFLADLIAVIPLELFILFIHLSTSTLVLLQGTRLFKFYRIRVLFQSTTDGLESRSQTYLKYSVYMVLLVYYTAAVWYFIVRNRSINDGHDTFNILLHTVSIGKPIDAVAVFGYFAVQQVSNFGCLVLGLAQSSYIFTILLQIITTLFFMFCLANATTAETYKRYDRLSLHGFVMSVKTAMKNLEVSTEICKQTDNHMRGQLQYNKGIDMVYGLQKSYAGVHPVFVKEVRAAAFTAPLRHTALFAELSEDIITDLSVNFHAALFSPGEIIVYSGEVCKEMHLILDGFCRISENAGESRVIGRGEVLCATELFFGIPIVNSIVTLTHCRLLSIDCEDLMRALRFHPEVLLEIRSAVTNIVETTTLTTFSTTQNFEVHFDADNKKNRSFKNFGYRLAMDTREGVDFHAYFDRLGFFGFLRYLFMRHTITPYGSFIRYWEALRCIFAFATAVLSISYISMCTDCVWYYVLLFLDITAYIDIYVKHHITYFDERGIEITHPLKTAIHYWKNSFIIDVLGVIPLETIATPLYSSKKKQLYCKTLRLFQVYRIVGGISYFDKDFISPPKLWTIIKFIPLIILTINAVGSVLINMTCDFSDSIRASQNFSAGVRCYERSWITQSKFQRPLGPGRTYLYALYTSTMILAGSGLGGFSVYNMTEVFFVAVLIGLGYLFFICITAKIIAANLYRDSDLTSYQEAMSSLVEFLSYRRIDETLRKQVIDHFEYVWRERRGKNLFKIIRSFHCALQEDVLFDVYGKAMNKSAVFENANTSFFRSLLLKTKSEIIMNEGIICKVNDVHKKIYFLFKGQVEVLGPDYNRLLVLPVGSLFGNIDNCPIIRQTLTMVAKGHVEVLSIDSTEFHGIISSYHQLKFQYRTLILLNTDYLLGGPPPSTDFADEEMASVEEGRTATVSSFKLLHRVNAWKNLKQPDVVSVWDLFILIVVCYFGFLLQLYQIAVQEHTTAAITILYCLDFLYVVHICSKFQRGYKDEFGILINDKRKIALRYLKMGTGFRLDIVTVIPVELFAFIITELERRWMIWSLCRCNRFIRIFFVMEYFYKKKRQLNINVIFTRTISLLAAIFLLLQVFSSLLILFSCINPEINVSPPISCRWSNITSAEKFRVYAHEFSIIMYITTTMGTEEYFPNSAFLIAYLICILIMGRFITAIFVSEMVVTLDSVYHNKVLYEEYITKLKEHMARERTSPALLDRVWLYVRLLWKSKRGLQFPILLEEAPYYLREAVLNSMFGYHLRRHELFQRCHVDLIRQIAAQMRPCTFFSGDYITFINDSDECMYFIDEGTVEALSEDDMYSEKVEKTLNAGDMFGLDQGIYFHCGHTYTYRAKVHTVILILKRKDWIEMLQFFPASKALIYDEKKEFVNHRKT